jgi:hypothetical protein
MYPLFVLAQHYADATRPRKAENAQPGAPVQAPSRFVAARARRRARRRAGQTP